MNQLFAMIQSLHIVDLAHIRDLVVPFRPGLNALTGESGAGKSVVLDALALIAGATRPRLRARTGTKSGFAEAEFLISEETLAGPLGDCLERNGLREAADQMLVLGRRVEASGRSRCFFQGQTVSRAVLSEIAHCLLELCGQAEAHSLRTPAAQLLALDRFGQLLEERRTVEALVRDLKVREAELNDAEGRAYEAERRRDFLEFQLGELDALRIAEASDLQARLMELETRLECRSLFSETATLLNGSPQPLIPTLTWLLRRAEHEMPARGGDEESSESAVHELQEQLQKLVQLSSAVEQLCRSVLDDDVTIQRERDQLASVVDELRAVARKHRVELGQLCERRNAVAQELESLEEEALRVEELREKCSEARSECDRRARTLHKRRRAAARRLEHAVGRELESLGMAGAGLTAHLSEGDLVRSGISHLEFGFAPHKNAAGASLARVASGGELARVLLAFRLATDSPGITLSFDEIDAGAGGQTANRIAESLQRASAGGQVLCVTHWPQVASHADHHLHVDKRPTKDGVEVWLNVLEGDDRLVELSRMLGGSPDSKTESSALEHAARLLHPNAA